MRSTPSSARRLAAVAVLALLPLGAAASGRWSRADADALQQKLVQIALNGMAQEPAARRVTVLEREINAYLAVHVAMPEGIVDPVVRLLPENRLTGRAIVDLDAIRAAQPEQSVLSPWALLRGKLPVEATGTLKTGNGVGAFTLESATVGGVPVPKTVLQQVVAYYTRSEAQPNGIDFEAPFKLPVRIREIRTGQGHALVVQ
ncbi:MAG TPA: hypothetical protein VF198_17755 [Vicinamibacterales bacterium]